MYTRGKKKRNNILEYWCWWNPSASKIDTYQYSKCKIWAHGLHLQFLTSKKHYVLHLARNMLRRLAVVGLRKRVHSREGILKSWTCQIHKIAPSHFLETQIQLQAGSLSLSQSSHLSHTNIQVNKKTKQCLLTDPVVTSSAVCKP